MHTRTYLLCAALCLIPSLTWRDAFSKEPASSTFVAKVGAETITQGQLESRLHQTPAPQLALFGNDAETVGKRFLENVLIPERLFSQAAEAQKLADTPATRLRIQDTYRISLTQAIETEIREHGGVHPEELASYFEQNRDRFQTPERLHLARILCASKGEAEELLEALKKPGGEKQWFDLAREHSSDKATHERGGDLGLIGSDGQSSEVSVKVDPALFTAAKKVKDGQYAPDPIAEGDKFAVVWRRGSMPAQTRTLEQETPAIRQLLMRQKVESRINELLSKLRKESVSISDDASSLLTYVELKSPEEIIPNSKPSSKPVTGAPNSPSSAKPQPSLGPWGVR